MHPALFLGNRPCAVAVIGDGVGVCIHICGGIHIEGTAGDGQVIAGIAGRDLNQATALSHVEGTAVDDDLLDVIGVHVYIEDGLIGVKGAAVDGGDGGYIGNVVVEMNACTVTLAVMIRIEFAVVDDHIAGEVDNNAGSALTVKGTAVDHYAHSVGIRGILLAEDHGIVVGILAALDGDGGMARYDSRSLPMAVFYLVDFTVDAVSAVVIGVAQHEIVGGIAGVAGAYNRAPQGVAVEVDGNVLRYSQIGGFNGDIACQDDVAVVDCILQLRKGGHDGGSFAAPGGAGLCDGHGDGAEGFVCVDCRTADAEVG